jgi:trimethylamine-N-oxide reductase (cytochrome c)
MFRDYYQADDVTKLKGAPLLETPSRKIEFESQLLKKWFPNDEERPPVPHYIPPPEMVDPILSSRYPLMMMTPHSQYRMHTISSEVSWLKEISSYKMKGTDGYFYECLWIHPKDAAARGIKNGNITKAWNDRATVLFAAYVTERIVPGVVRACESARYDPVDQHAPDIVDRGGCVALLCSDKPTSKHASGMSVNCFRVQVAKWEDQ